MTSEETAAMRRALRLSLRGPATGVNPRVGCVILDSAGRIVAEGWHRGAGTPHAEIMALAGLPEGDAVGSTLVVTLEPCNHVGRTGPCSEAIIAAGVGRVVYGVADPGCRSSGGAERLRAAGIEVVSGLLAGEIGEVLDDWLVAARLGRPFVTLKWASSLDGRIAAEDGSSKWITGAAARQRVHEQREASDAIITGTGTVLADDPSLTARGDGGELLARQPLPVIVGRRDLPSSAAVYRHPRAPVQLRTHDLEEVLQTLHGMGVRRVFLEAGPALVTAFVASGLVDEYAVYLAPTLIGGPRLAVTDIGVGSIAEQRRLSLVSVERLGNDMLVIARPLPFDAATGEPAEVRDGDGPAASIAEASATEEGV